MTDQTGAVVAVTVLSLEHGQNLNFAIPAQAISDLPEVDLPIAAIIDVFSKADGSAVYTVRGFGFGNDCLEILSEEKRREKEMPPGELYVNEICWECSDPPRPQIIVADKIWGLNLPVTYTCSDQLRLIKVDYYVDHFDEPTRSKLEDQLNSKYGMPDTIDVNTMEEALDIGCEELMLAYDVFRGDAQIKRWVVDSRFHRGPEGLIPHIFLQYFDPILLREIAHENGRGQDDQF